MGMYSDRTKKMMRKFACQEEIVEKISESGRDDISRRFIPSPFKNGNLIHTPYSDETTSRETNCVGENKFLRQLKIRNLLVASLVRETFLFLQERLREKEIQSKLWIGNVPAVCLLDV